MINREDHDSEFYKPNAKKVPFRPYPESHVDDCPEGTCDHLPGVRKGNEPHTAHPETE